METRWIDLEEETRSGGGRSRWLSEAKRSLAVEWRVNHKTVPGGAWSSRWRTRPGGQRLWSRAKGSRSGGVVGGGSLSAEGGGRLPLLSSGEMETTSGLGVDLVEEIDEGLVDQNAAFGSGPARSKLWSTSMDKGTWPLDRIARRASARCPSWTWRPVQTLAELVLGFVVMCPWTQDTESARI